MGLSPFASPYALWLQKTGRKEAELTLPMKRGTELEPAARAAYEELTGSVMQPLVLEEGIYSASLDGMTLAGDLVLEIKCPMQGRQSKLWQAVSEGIVPEHYQIQIQHQLMVSGAGCGHLWVFDGNANGMLTEVPRDNSMISRILEAWQQFEPFLAKDSPPPLTDADTRLRTDAPWLEMAQAFIQAKAQAEEAASGLETAREALLKLTEHPREQGAGVTVTRFWKQGGVDYKRVPGLEGVDLDLYRRKAAAEVRITVAG
jgi:putative phage-type endonuclease